MNQWAFHLSLLPAIHCPGCPESLWLPVTSTGAAPPPPPPAPLGAPLAIAASPLLLWHAGLRPYTCCLLVGHVIYIVVLPGAGAVLCPGPIVFASVSWPYLSRGAGDFCLVLSIPPANRSSVLLVFSQNQLYLFSHLYLR